MRNSLTIATLAVVILASGGALFAVNEREVRQRNLQPRERVSVEGRVQNAEGNIVPGARVFFEREDFLRGALPSATTDQQGRFVIRNLSPGRYRVYASKEVDGYPLPTSGFYANDSAYISFVEVREQSVTSDVIIQLAPRVGRLIGRLRNAATNRPIEGGSENNSTLRG